MWTLLAALAHAAPPGPGPYAPPAEDQRAWERLADRHAPPRFVRIDVGAPLPFSGPLAEDGLSADPSGTLLVRTDDGVVVVGPDDAVRWQGTVDSPLRGAFLYAAGERALLIAEDRQRAWSLDVASGALSEHPHPSPGGVVVAHGGDRVLMEQGQERILVDLASGETGPTWPAADVWNPWLSPDGTRLIAIDQDGKLQVWSTAPAKKPKPLARTSLGSVASPVIGPDSLAFPDTEQPVWRRVHWSDGALTTTPDAHLAGAVFLDEEHRWVHTRELLLDGSLEIAPTRWAAGWQGLVRVGPEPVDHRYIRQDPWPMALGAPVVPAEPSWRVARARDAGQGQQILQAPAYDPTEEEPGSHALVDHLRGADPASAWVAWLHLPDEAPSTLIAAPMAGGGTVARQLTGTGLGLGPTTRRPVRLLVVHPVHRA